MPHHLAHSPASRFLCVGFQNVNTVAVCIDAFHEAEIASGGCVTPLAYKILCVRFTPIVHDDPSVHTTASLSARGATLDTSGWLALTRPGLSPGKKRQASLGALTISDDGAVPIHDRLGDGNTTDDRTPIETWEALRQLCNRADFLYIADCKLCTREQRGHIARPGGRFITVLPRTRKEDAWFRRHIQDHDITWREVLHEPNRRCVNAALNIGSVNELALCSAEGYRRVGVFSSLKAENDPNARLKALEKTYASIEALNEKLKGKRTRPKERGRVFEAAQTILEQSGAQRWVDVDIVEHDDVLYRQKGAGRPGPNTGYEKQIRTRFEVLYQPNAEAIAYEAKSDGMFPLQSRSTVAQGGFEKVPLPAQAREAP